MRSGTNVIKNCANKVFPFFQKKAAGLKMRSAAFSILLPLGTAVEPDRGVLCTGREKSQTSDDVWDFCVFTTL